MLLRIKPSIRTYNKIPIRLLWLRTNLCQHLGGLSRCNRNKGLFQPNQYIEPELHKRNYSELVLEQHHSEDFDSISENINFVVLFKELEKVSVQLLNGRLQKAYESLSKLESSYITLEQLELCIGFLVAQKTTPGKVQQWFFFCQRSKKASQLSDYHYEKLNFYVSFNHTTLKLLKKIVPNYDFSWLTLGNRNQSSWNNPLHCIIYSYICQLNRYYDKNFLCERLDFEKNTPDDIYLIAKSSINILDNIISNFENQPDLSQIMIIIQNLKSASLATGRVNFLLEAVSFLKRMTKLISIKTPVPYTVLMEGFSSLNSKKLSDSVSGRLKHCLELRKLMIENECRFDSTQQLLPLLISCYPPEFSSGNLLKLKMPLSGYFIRKYRFSVYLRVIERERKRDSVPINDSYFNYILGLESLNYYSKIPFPKRWKDLHKSYNIAFSQLSFRILFACRRYEIFYFDGFKEGFDSFEELLASGKIKSYRLEDSLIESLVDAVIFYDDFHYHKKACDLFMKIGFEKIPKHSIFQLSSGVSSRTELLTKKYIEKAIAHHIGSDIAPIILMRFYARSHQVSKAYSFLLTYVSEYAARIPFKIRPLELDSQEYFIELVLDSEAEMENISPLNSLSMETIVIFSEFIECLLNQGFSDQAYFLFKSLYNFIEKLPHPYFPTKTLLKISELENTQLDHLSPNQLHDDFKSSTWIESNLANSLVDIERFYLILIVFRPFQFPKKTSSIPF